MSMSRNYPKYIGVNPNGIREENGSYTFKSPAGQTDRALINVDGVESTGLLIHPTVLGTGSEVLQIDVNQAAVVAGPITINCSLTVNGTLRVV